MKLPAGISLKTLRWLPTLIMGVLGAISLSVCLWSWAEWNSVRSALNEQQTLFARAQQLVNQQPRIESTLKAYGDYLTVSGSDEEAFQHLLAMVEQLASRATVQIVNLKPRPAERSTEAAEYSVELDCSAPAPALVQFIHALEYGPALLRVERLRINPALRDPQRLDAQLLVTYTNLL